MYAFWPISGIAVIAANLKCRHNAEKQDGGGRIQHRQKNSAKPAVLCYDKREGADGIKNEGTGKRIKV